MHSGKISLDDRLPTQLSQLLERDTRCLGDTCEHSPSAVGSVLDRWDCAEVAVEVNVIEPVNGLGLRNLTILRAAPPAEVADKWRFGHRVHRFRDGVVADFAS